MSNIFDNKKFWKSLDEEKQSSEFKDYWLHREFPEGASESNDVDRRHFLKIMGASFALAGLGLSGCRQPERHLLPQSKQPEKDIPGVPNYYSTSRPTARGNIPIIVETHTARPTKIEGNPSYSEYGGGTDTFTQASILNLYDPDRSAKSYRKHKKEISKAEVLDILKSLHKRYLESKGEGLAFLAEQSTSPSRQRLVSEIKEQYPNAKWVEYEAIDQDNPVRAYKEMASTSVRAVYDFREAKRIVSLDADFLSSREPGHLKYIRDYANGRRVKSNKEVSNMNRLYVVEGNYTITGSSADHRLRVEGGQIPIVARLMAASLLEQAGGDASLISFLKESSSLFKIDQAWIDECVKDLLENKQKSVIIAGSHLLEEVHSLVALMNQVLEANGKIVNYLELPEYKGDKLSDLESALKDDAVKTLLVLGGNPAYNLVNSIDFESLSKRGIEVIRHGYDFDETSEVADVHIAMTHFLESWGDGYTWEGTLVPVQPVIVPLFDGFSELQLLGHILGKEGFDVFSYVKETFDTLSGGKSFEEWLALGVYREEKKSVFAPKDLSIDGSKLLDQIKKSEVQIGNYSANYLDICLVPSLQVWDGRYNNNSWLQECPDPMTKLSWDNALLISPKLAKTLQEETGIPILSRTSVMNEIGQAKVNENNFKVGREHAFIGTLKSNGTSIKGPIHVLPGLADYTVIVPLGYGRKTVGGVGQGTGFDSFTLLEGNNYIISGANLKVTDDVMKLANTQEHWSMEGRAIMRETTAQEYKKDSDFVNKMGLESHSPPIFGTAQNDPLNEKVNKIPRGGSIYQTPDFTGKQQWGMSIDLNTCVGCNACVIACQSENNIAVVGKDQVLRGREMHWIRLDRYFSTPKDIWTELPEEPQVSFMPLTCLHCELAPCEMVCPVNATVHDEEGLNVMAYNRCVGTRYCANNCPYKVRRFNFFDWNKRKIGHFYQGPLGPSGVPELKQMQKNPDVTVRMRGVMEKCTFCVQRIEAAKIHQRNKAKDSSDIKVPDGTIQTACQQVCPADSIVFGDVADPYSAVTQLKNQDRDYRLLGYLNTRPRLTYLAKIRNPNENMPDYYKKPYSHKEYDDRYGGHHEAHSHEKEEQKHEPMVNLK